MLRMFFSVHQVVAMKCELCHHANAEEAIHKVVNGEDCELYVCSACAQKEILPPTQEEHPAKVTTFMTPTELPQELASLVEKVLEATVEIVGKPHLKNEVACPCCGMTRTECRKVARLGCMMCYGLFKDDVERAVKEMQRATQHHGKKPKHALSDEQIQAMFDELKAALAAHDRTLFLEVAQRIQKAGFFPPFTHTGASSK